ncbi:hypothetical protein A6452_22635 [Bradyrhizobium elkanii]|nr:hypothetical protein A6452_22635 [Bradyrhizobium elkanii]
MVEASAATKWRADRFVLLLHEPGAARQVVIAELNCGYQGSTNAMEFALSVSDAWQGRGIGQALVRWLEGRARERGAVCLYGDTFRSNGAALALARKLEFLTLNHHADWQLVRCEKMIGKAEPYDLGAIIVDCDDK